MDAREAMLFVQIIGQLLISDGILADSERDYLERVMDSLGLGDAERKEALAGISLDSPVKARVAALSPEARRRLVDEAKRAISVDGDAHAREIELIEEIEQLTRG